MSSPKAFISNKNSLVQDETRFNPVDTYTPNTNKTLREDDIFDDLAKCLQQYQTKKPRSKKKEVFVKICCISVNFCDLLGLLDVVPFGTIHSIKPYITYN